MLQELLKMAESRISGTALQLNKELNLESKKWAIVGGFVRDTLLSCKYSTDIISPDIDIAVIGELPDLKTHGTIRSYARNSYGGMKIETTSFNEIDMWRIESNLSKKARNHYSIVGKSFRREKIKCKFRYTSNRCTNNLGKSYLNEIDLNANAVIYIYPENKILAHNDWSAFISKHEICTVNNQSPLPHLQPIRAFALAQKLKNTTKLNFYINENINAKLIEYNNANKTNVLQYLDKKIQGNKWHKSVLHSYLQTIKDKK